MKRAPKTLVDDVFTSGPSAPDAGLDSGAIDADGDPIAVLRSLLAKSLEAVSGLPASSPRLNGARTEARNLTKAIAMLERERAKTETPEEIERRLRREDAETRREILWSVEQAERAAAERGVCIHCGQAVA